ncbi:TPA: ATP-binding protein [Pseudomonas aeruginosa]|uniref:ATP-binding protein n=1 Tax=Pseudomonas aeruginosa TaxID=287 RepID=UPI001E31FF5C|nr:ATP-binding protein [Pseudomonas aeruginosa]UFM86087.1 ATP-binding protein [Pseudomonas aeruginosa]
MTTIQPTFLGLVSSVSSSSVAVDLAASVESGIVVLEGRNYRIGQVGSFVKIPLGYNHLYGVISESSETSTVDADSKMSSDRKWIKVELVGESIGGSFDRGISEYPSIGDHVHFVVDSDLKSIFRKHLSSHFQVGRLSSSEGIEVSLDLDKLVARHSAILGSTGSGKSTSTASILRSMVINADESPLPSARVLLIDIHGEYGPALSDVAKTFSILPSGENQLYIPFWCVSTDKLIDFLCNNPNDSQRSLFMDKTVDEKRLGITGNDIKDIDTEKITSNTPLPYRLKKIWYDLCHEDSVNYTDNTMTTPAYAPNGEGSFEDLIAPKFLPPGAGTSPPKKGGTGAMKRQLDLMKSRLLDTQYSFLLEPGDWNPDKDGKIKKDLDGLLEDWLGHDKPITIFDLSGMPSARLTLLLGAVLDIIFESAIWGRNVTEGMRERPLLIVLEEAHRYLGKSESGHSKEMVQRIAKEGRKFGVGAMIVSQRPSEIDETILSQCGTIISLRINNSTDRGIVKAAMSDGLAGIVDSLPILRTGEAIIVGEAAQLPTRCRFNVLPDDKYPNSGDPKIGEKWSAARSEENYSKLVRAWRNQDSTQ